MNSQFGPVLLTNVLPSGHIFASPAQTMVVFDGIGVVDGLSKGDILAVGIGVKNGVVVVFASVVTKGFRSFGIFGVP